MKFDVTTAIIQARMGSTRLPGKVLKEVNGQPLLLHQIRRVKQAKSIDRIIIATSDATQDDAIVKFCEQHVVDYFRGSENDVLARYYNSAKAFGANTIVRLTADCPLCDPTIIDLTVDLFKKEKIDYAANTVPPETSTFPDGTDVEVFSMAALERAHREAQDGHDREHVTFYFWKHNNGFKTAQLKNNQDYSRYRFTVDYPEDLEVVEFIIKALYRKQHVGTMQEIINLLETNLEIKVKNAKYYFGIGWDFNK